MEPYNGPLSFFHRCTLALEVLYFMSSAMQLIITVVCHICYDLRCRSEEWRNLHIKGMSCFHRSHMIMLCDLLSFCRIYNIYNGSSVHNNISQKYKIYTTVSTFVYWLLTLRVLTLMLGHHQAYKNTSISSWNVSQFNMDPYHVLMSFIYVIWI
jgi:hypothetical protein